MTWHSPPIDFIKVNCDGSLMAHGHLAGFGCILRDDCGSYSCLGERFSSAKHAASAQLAYKEWSHPSIDLNSIIQQDRAL
ncbi:hypothetical protein PIB30_063563 [Stylosanthes scabra]|uniref:RNase H type-1 domain-containing protein n=1 Tax=Stylosanthes scabra TaxID=79078 RepID=A0ABU6VPP7_9FABA|nr:hypothetical protein [Stylosanthes scabra]